MLIATRMDRRLNRHADRRARPAQEETTQFTETRRGWLRLAGLRF
jgi:hypothetical protein